MVRTFLVLAIALFVFSATSVLAAERSFLENVDQHEVISIEDPEASQIFYGNLNNHPHTYEIVSEGSFSLSLEIQVPDTDEAQNNISGIVLEVLKNGSVREVARLRAADADWETFYEPFGGDSYRRSTSFERELNAGTYRIEISTPDNIEKYVLRVGVKNDVARRGYFTTLRDTARTKVFFGKSQFAVIQSPLVYVPLGILVIILVIFVFVSRRPFSIRY